MIKGKTVDIYRYHDKIAFAILGSNEDVTYISLEDAKRITEALDDFIYDLEHSEFESSGLTEVRINLD